MLVWYCNKYYLVIPVACVIGDKPAEAPAAPPTPPPRAEEPTPPPPAAAPPPVKPSSEAGPIPTTPPPLPPLPDKPLSVKPVDSIKPTPLQQVTAPPAGAPAEARTENRVGVIVMERKPKQNHCL